MIGLRVRYRADVWTVIEVLESAPTLILERSGAAHARQRDVYGRPFEYAHETLEVQVLSPDGTRLSDDILALDLIDG
jgi:hypothetical protein